MKKHFILLGALLSSAIAYSQVGINTENPNVTLDVVGKATDANSLDGITAPRLTGNQLRAKIYTIAQTGALVYITTPDTAPAGQTIDVKTIGYYYFNGTKWIPTEGNNIYNADGSITGTEGIRNLNLNGKILNFNGANRKTHWDSEGRIHQTATNTSTDAVMGFHNGNANLWIQQWSSDSQITASDGSTELGLKTHYTKDSAPITFGTSPGGNTTGLERMRITGEGNVGVNTSDPTEKFDNSGITRLRVLPQNGATNAINTTSDGDISSAQDQTFTASRTVVADVNGVLGTVSGIPSDAGSSKVLVIANAPGTQNIGGQFIPNAAIGQFTNESLDVYNAWTNNIFTVPANMGGIYIIVMQNSNTHVSIGSSTPTWHTMAYYEKSIDGGVNWNTMIKHTYADLAGTIVDNGNTLYWTGFLNVGDQVRIRFSCNATTNNIVNYGGLSITKLAQ
ncbi:hypothetical protein [Empedobacter brevis]|uniref:Bulb-type lectin domain-containing protein n=1 Tax=Empedobacter brevis NBRC 14943 = ATCC 43319 TaxID=1218108 RepID=A0A511NL16_9FLAO|nr:hypothetical protein [Empedobacter brevis]GEM53502.1 hypothetical protein EB1_32920 [Empedobacter brevis NBRC 14943 = ATCC 43319]